MVVGQDFNLRSLDYKPYDFYPETQNDTHFYIYVTTFIQDLIFNCNEIKQNVNMQLINLFLLDIYLLIIIYEFVYSSYF